VRRAARMGVHLGVCLRLKLLKLLERVCDGWGRHAEALGEDGRVAHRRAGLCRRAQARVRSLGQHALHQHSCAKTEQVAARTGYVMDVGRHDRGEGLRRRLLLVRVLHTQREHLHSRKGTLAALPSRISTCRLTTLTVAQQPDTARHVCVVALQSQLSHRQRRAGPTPARRPPAGPHGHLLLRTAQPHTSCAAAGSSPSPGA